MVFVFEYDHIITVALVVDQVMEGLVTISFNLFSDFDRVYGFTFCYLL